MEKVLRSCDLCDRPITNFNPDSTNPYQNGPGFVNLHKLLIDEYDIQHTCLPCITLISTVIRHEINTIKESKNEKTVA